MPSCTSCGKQIGPGDSFYALELEENVELWTCVDVDCLNKVLMDEIEDCYHPKILLGTLID